MKQIQRTVQLQRLLTAPSGIGVRVEIRQATFHWKEGLVGLKGSMVHTDANSLVYVNLKKHDHGVNNGFKPEHLNALDASQTGGG